MYVRPFVFGAVFTTLALAAGCCHTHKSCAPPCASAAPACCAPAVPAAPAPAAAYSVPPAPCCGNP